MAICIPIAALFSYWAEVAPCAFGVGATAGKWAAAAHRDRTTGGPPAPPAGQHHKPEPKRHFSKARHAFETTSKKAISSGHRRILIYFCRPPPRKERGACERVERLQSRPDTHTSRTVRPRPRRSCARTKARAVCERLRLARTCSARREPSFARRARTTFCTPRHVSPRAGKVRDRSAGERGDRAHGYRVRASECVWPRSRSPTGALALCAVESRSPGYELAGTGTTCVRERSLHAQSARHARGCNRSRAPPKQDFALCCFE